MNSKQSVFCLSPSSPTRFLFYVCIIVITLTSKAISTSYSGGNKTDHLALLKMKSMITQDPYGALVSWNESFHFCDWTGVTCGKRHRRVTRVTLESLGLQGTLSPHVGNLSFLRVLELGDNSFQGTIPCELGRLFRLRFLYLYRNKLNGSIPTNISGCSNLQALGLSGNELTGSIPKEMSFLSKLSFLAIYYNKLTGGIPPSLGNHTSLEVFSVTGNPLGGRIPNTIGNWKNLEEFKCNGCNLDGIIPHELGCLSKLKSLYLGLNKFHGVIPSNISSCSNLEELDLSYNKLVGTIPKEINFLSKLTIILLYNNNLTGGIPSFLMNMTSLEVLSVQENPFGGSIPHTLGHLKSLKELHVGGCNLSGTIPDSLYNLSLLINISLAENQLNGSLHPAIGEMLPNLVFFQIWGNQLSGPLPPSISNCSRLRYFEVSLNMFSGKLTVNFSKLKDVYFIGLLYNLFGSKDPDDMKFIDSMKNCTKLVTLELGYCNFQGPLPWSIGNLSSQLSYLRLYGNQLHGSIPTSIGNLVGLTTLDLAGNHITGRIPSTIGNLQKLQALYLHKNQLSGIIPDAIGDLSMLIKLILFSNKLVGLIPSSLGKCQNLLALYLNDNKLSGKIPTQLLQIQSLTIILNLSQNNLFGSLPTEVGDLKKLITMDLSDNNLSGNIPRSIGDCASLSSLSLRGNFFQGIIPPSFISLKAMVEIDISHNNLSGKIPSFFEKMKLQYLDMSYNNFEGVVPMVGVFANESEFSVLGNSRLCGGIVELGLPKCKETRKHVKKFPLFVIFILATSTLFTIASLACVWYKKKKKSHLSQLSTSEKFLRVSYDQLLKATNGFSEANLIGNGAFSSVYKGVLDEDDNKIVAVKVLRLQNRGAQSSFMRECEAWRSIRHRNLLRIITSCSSIDFQGNDFKALVYEFMSKGSLHDWLHSSEGTFGLNLVQRINILVDIGCALDYIHNHCVPTLVHGDLKPSNVLLDDDMVAHIGDFGLARFLETTSYQTSSTGIRGTIGYVAPEYGLGNEMTRSGDVYSFGMLLLEVMTGKKPTDDIFKEGFNLHKFASTALQDHVRNVIDVNILNIYQGLFSFNNDANAKKIDECLTSIVKIGVSCSLDSPQERIEIEKVVQELRRNQDIVQNIEVKYCLVFYLPH